MVSPIQWPTSVTMLVGEDQTAVACQACVSGQQYALQSSALTAESAGVYTSTFALQQHVAAGQHPDQQPLDHVGLPDDHAADGLQQRQGELRVDGAAEDLGDARRPRLALALAGHGAHGAV